MKCSKCSAEISSIDIGATKKFINRGAKEYFCLSCIADKYQLSLDFINKKIDGFRKQGCTLFPKEE